MARHSIQVDPRVREARSARLQALRESGTSAQLALDTGLKASHVDRLTATERTSRSLDESAGDDAPPLRETVVDAGAEQVLAMLDELGDRERAVLCARFGLGTPELTLRKRAEFNRAMRRELVAAVEELTGAGVVAFLAASHAAPDVVVQVFLLDRAVQHRVDRGTAGERPHVVAVS